MVKYNLKNLITIIILLYQVVSYGQDTTGYHNKILTKFKKDIVNVSFKDPYSFELLSLTYRMETNRSILEYEITLDSLSQNYSFLSKKQKNEKFKNMNSNIEKLNKMSVEEKNVILYYFVILECRGSNSFGNLVYSKYLGYYYDKTDILDLTLTEN